MLTLAEEKANKIATEKANQIEKKISTSIDKTVKSYQFPLYKERIDNNGKKAILK